MQAINPQILISDSLNSLQNSETVSHQCKICGAPTIHLNYGILTCDSCKVFFRRNARKEKKDFQCRFGGICEINVYNRRVCAFCRLEKCFTSGMKVDLIRCPRLDKKPVKKDKSQQLSTLNLLQSDTSTLDSNQWTLLSNLIYNYDERKLLSIAQQFIDQSSLIMIDFTLPKQFFRTIYETSGQYVRSNGDLCTLSSDDRSAFLRNVTDNVTCLGASFTWSWSQLYNSKSFINILINFYGDNSIKFIRRILKFIDPDIIIAKLTLSLFAFSNNTSIFSSHKPFDTLAIFHIQNIYAEVTWKYLVYKYGYYQSIQRFLNLIQCLLAATTTISDAQNIEKHINDITSLVEQIEVSLIIDDIECIV